MAFRMMMLGKKLGMTQIFVDGERIPVTVLELGPNTVVQKKTKDSKDGYNSVQLGFGDKDHKRANKAMAGHFKRADQKPKWVLKELRIDDDAKINDFQVGQEIKADIFKEGEFIDVAGITKGKGFQGVMRRHHMKGAKNATHGTHEYRRHGGSIGTNMTPGRTLPNVKMGGQYGNETVTTLNLTIAKIIAEDGLLLIEGSVPGAKNGTLVVRGAVKKKNAGRKKALGRFLAARRSSRAQQRAHRERSSLGTSALSFFGVEPPRYERNGKPCAAFTSERMAVVSRTPKRPNWIPNPSGLFQRTVPGRRMNGSICTSTTTGAPNGY